jgi:hypothetical protein
MSYLNKITEREKGESEREKENIFLKTCKNFFEDGVRLDFCPRALFLNI